MGFEAETAAARRACARTIESFRAQRAVADAVSAPRALITGITGQDGSYLAELLLAKGYEVFGRRARLADARFHEPRRTSATDLTLVQGDLLDQMTLLDAINRAAAATSSTTSPRRRSSPRRGTSR